MTVVSPPNTLVCAVTSGEQTAADSQPYLVFLFSHVWTLCLDLSRYAHWGAKSVVDFSCCAILLLLVYVCADLIIHRILIE